MIDRVLLVRRLLLLLRDVSMLALAVGELPLPVPMLVRSLAKATALVVAVTLLPMPEPVRIALSSGALLCLLLLRLHLLQFLHHRFWLWRMLRGVLCGIPRWPDALRFSSRLDLGRIGGSATLRRLIC